MFRYWSTDFEGAGYEDVVFELDCDGGGEEGAEEGEEEHGVMVVGGCGARGRGRWCGGVGRVARFWGSRVAENRERGGRWVEKWEVGEWRAFPCCSGSSGWCSVWGRT